MPLFMDIHTVDSDSFTVEDVVKAHMKDLAIQDDYGVKQLKYWVNVEAKTLFCLMVGPTKEACHEVHKQSHGNTACNIIEVSDDEFNLFLGNGTDINDLAQTVSREIDTGYRTLLSISLLDLSGMHERHSNKAIEIIKHHKGTPIARPDDQITASFIYASEAILCTLDLREYLNSRPGNVEFILAVSSGRPVDEKGDMLFEETKNKIQNMCTSGQANTIQIDFETKQLSDQERSFHSIPEDGFNIIRSEHFIFLNRLFQVLDDLLSDPNFSCEHFHSSMGSSKSRLYRNLKSLTGMAPNHFIQELRLRRSLNEIKNSHRTISELSFALGFNSPTYFTKVFRKRFGISPTAYAKFHLEKMI